jgi:hypothetical protein
MQKLNCVKNSIYYWCVLFLVYSVFLKSQTSMYSITGKALQSNNSPIEFGNVIALNFKDSSIIKGEPLVNGELKLRGLSIDSVIIKVTAVGFKDVYKLVRRIANDSIVDIGTFILLNDNTLDEVTVRAKVSLFEMDGEKVKVNVEGTSLTAAGNALDVLRRSPSVMVGSNDAVSVFGRGNAIIYLDGMLITSVDILKSIPSSDIKTIEIISNPSAKYDAGGRAVINILTIRNTLEGYNGNIIHNTLYIKQLFTYSGLRFNYSKKKLSLSAGYGTNMGYQWNSNDYERLYAKNDTTKIQLKNSIYENEQYANVHYYRAGINYKMDSTSSIRFQFSGFYNNRKNVSDNKNNIAQNKKEVYVLQTNTQSKPTTINSSFNANYVKQFDTLGTELFVAAQYGNFNIDALATINQTATVNNISSIASKRNTNKNNIQIISAQLDFTKVFNKVWRLESGFKNANINKTSTLNFENYKSGIGYVSDLAYLNGFSFNENIAALYSELKYKKSKINYRIGLRSELTQSNGFSKTLNQKIIDRSYINIFPNAYFGYDFTKDLTTSLTLSSRINRPTFQDLDPFINYIDSLSSFRGNPYLLPEYTNSVEAALVYMKEANITFGYSRTNGKMSLVVDKLNDSTDAFTAITKNLKQAETINAGITLPYELSWWTTSNYFGYFLNNFSYVLNGQTIKNNQPTFSIYLYNEFRFKKVASLEITYEYTSAAVDGIFTSKPFSMLSATAKKTFLNDKLVCRISANDILSSYITQGGSNIPLYTINYYTRFPTHYFLLALNYKFGKLKNSDYKSKSVSDDEFNRVKAAK